MTVAERLGVGEYFLVRMDEFTAHPERYEEFQFQTAAKAVDVALLETIKYMSAEQAGSPLTPRRSKNCRVSGKLPAEPSLRSIGSFPRHAISRRSAG